ncbi:MAG: hypothetical protein U0802_14525 [Candidatus Binatia bacterium]
MPLGSYEKLLKFRRLVEVEEVTDTVTNVLEYKGASRTSASTAAAAWSAARCSTRWRGCASAAGRRSASRTRASPAVAPCSPSPSTTSIANLEHPLPMAVVDADGGGRLYLQIADADDIQISERVAFTYRRLHEGAGNRNYYWKARPIRES